jgi:hypothetical protein
MDELGPRYLHTQSCRTEAASRSRFVHQLPRYMGVRPVRSQWMISGKH